jgi:hypothetical protein
MLIWHFGQIFSKRPPKFFRPGKMIFRAVLAILALIAGFWIHFLREILEIVEKKGLRSGGGE